MKKRLTVMACVTFVSGFLCEHPVDASVITLASATQGDGTVLVRRLDTRTPNNDNVPDTQFNLNSIDIRTEFRSLGPIDIVFDVIDSGGTTEYEFSGGVENGTGVEWIAYDLELGFGTGDGFVRAGPLALLDFDTPEKDSRFFFVSFFTSLSHTADAIHASDGLVPIGYVPLVAFSIDVPDDLGEIHPEGVSQFTLRQFPTPVPEPSVVLLLGFGAATLTALGRLVTDKRRGDM
jgi:hypothetical protein